MLCEVDAAPPARAKALRETTQDEVLAQKGGKAREGEGMGGVEKEMVSKGK